jgi:superfamily II DNA/RNA helicase
VDVVAKSLKAYGFDASPIHGDLDQSLRTRTLEAFRSGELKLLVASDVAARGLDIPDVSHVFNFDVPHHADDYVHRIGRTGRAGKKGDTFMIVTPADGRSLDKVLKLIGQAPDEIKLDVDWSQAGESRGGARERPARGDAKPARGRDRDRPRREAAPRAEAAPVETPAPAPVEVAPPAPVVQAEAAPTPARDEQRPSRRSRGGRGERGERPAPAAAEPRQERSEPRHDRNEPRHERGRDREPSVVGFGDDTPAFLVRR